MGFIPVKLNKQSLTIFDAIRNFFKGTEFTFDEGAFDLKGIGVDVFKMDLSPVSLKPHKEEDASSHETFLGEHHS